ncbi:FeoA family protein [Desulfosoma caldarium]|uniref:Fe2+ transport system protein FeoA n=1 Tax=Desulfosoma caldarium TaxID=610254 RepID=A0A3N1VNN6_9BACT|nr:FeoA family protein [Desulfosoma caldarium]ROR01832.1 Fe2+ transport system protein FeoA [Desulfosoma caldarium]
MRWWSMTMQCCSSHPRDESFRGSTIPLSMAPSGTRLLVRRIEGGRKLCARMAALGIYPGAELEVLCAGCDRPCLVKVHGSTLSLGAGVSSKILVCGPLT